MCTLLLVDILFLRLKLEWFQLRKDLDFKIWNIYPKLLCLRFDVSNICSKGLPWAIVDCTKYINMISYLAWKGFDDESVHNPEGPWPFLLQKFIMLKYLQLTLCRKKIEQHKNRGRFLPLSLNLVDSSQMERMEISCL